MSSSTIKTNLKNESASQTGSTDKSAFRLIIAGTGGQGAIRASQILGWAGTNSGLKVRTAETHGMAQRGGSVVCYVGMGHVNGPLFPRGTANVIMAFEEIEALRNLDYANKETYFLVSKTRSIPPGLYFRDETYPDEKDIIETLEKVSSHVYFIDAKEIAMASGEPRAENVVMLAFLYATGLLPFDDELLLETVLSFVPKKAIEANKKAFKVGLEKAKEFFSQSDDYGGAK